MAGRRVGSISGALKTLYLNEALLDFQGVHFFKQLQIKRKLTVTLQVMMGNSFALLVQRQNDGMDGGESSGRYRIVGKCFRNVSLLKLEFLNISSSS